MFVVQTVSLGSLPALPMRQTQQVPGGFNPGVLQQTPRYHQVIRQEHLDGIMLDSLSPAVGMEVSGSQWYDTDL